MQTGKMEGLTADDAAVDITKTKIVFLVTVEVKCDSLPDLDIAALADSIGDSISSQLDFINDDYTDCYLDDADGADEIEVNLDSVTHQALV